MVAIFVPEVPSIAVEDGLVHIRWGDGDESFWKPSTFRAFVEQGRRELDAFDRQQSGVVAFERRSG